MRHHLHHLYEHAHAPQTAVMNPAATVVIPAAVGRMVLLRWMGRIDTAAAAAAAVYLREDSYIPILPSLLAQSGIPSPTWNTVEQGK